MVGKVGIFEVGRRYENRRGPYEVIAITPPQLRIRYDTGELMEVDLEIQTRIIENMSRAPAPASRQARASNPSSGIRKTRPRRKHPVTASLSGHVQTRHHGTSAHHPDGEFVPGQIYRRRDLHATYGGQEQGGICTPRAFAVVLLFTGQGGDTYGYKDHWDDNDTFHYFGEGQIGDMEFARGNRAVRDHAADGKELHLFEALGGGNVRYVSVMTYTGYEYVPDVPDASGKPRTAIVFRLKPS